jgi:periplasmic protein CpxP/Spy
MSNSYASNRLTRAVAAALCLMCAAGAAMAGAGPDGPPPGDGPGPHGCGQSWHPGPPGPPGMGGMGGPMGFLGEDHPPPYLMGMKLSDEQEDKVFSILHAAAPEFREHMKAARKARDALRELGQSSAYDANKAAVLAQSEASAESQLSLLHARTDHDIFLLLTQEQRTQIADKRRQHEGHPDREAPPR